jgi:hypothetical protein
MPTLIDEVSLALTGNMPSVEYNLAVQPDDDAVR